VEAVTNNTEDPRVTLLAAPMSRYQKIAVAVLLALCMLDGLDVMAMTFAAPVIRALWGINQSQVGLVLSSGLLGMAAGSLLLAPFADLVGRRRMVFFSLAVMVSGTLWSAITHNVTDLMLSRVYTGLGIGTMIAIISSLAAEYSSARSRDFCQAMFSIGFPMGGMLGGVLASRLLPTHGWASIFIVASSLGMVMLPLVWVWLPEPIAPMIARPKADTLARVNAYLQRCGLDSVACLPAPPTEAKSAPWKTLFTGGHAAITLLITSIYFLHVITLFFAQTWVPSLVVALGFAPSRAALVGICLNIGGIISGLLLGSTSMRFGLKPLVVGTMFCGALVTALYGSIPADFLLLAIATAAMGFFLQGAMMGLYAVIARTFPAHMRASGAGFVIGVGRIGSAVGPAAAGILMTAGVTRSHVAIAMALPTLIAALLLLKFKVRPPTTA